MEREKKVEDSKVNPNKIRIKTKQYDKKANDSETEKMKHLETTKDTNPTLTQDNFRKRVYLYY